MVEMLTWPVNLLSSLPSLNKDTVMDEFEKKALDRAQKWVGTGMGYAIEHGTRPSTIGSVLCSNPLAMLAWYVCLDLCRKYAK
jgi:microsomal epoxide hydrolase